jgi:hypothetical protein
MTLASGEYQIRTTREVVVWKAPDAEGDGKPVWNTQFDDQGRQIGRVRAKDAQGKEIFEYEAPEGFQNRPGYDHTDNYVLVDERGDVVRNPAGEAVGIKPGQALVLNSDGTVEVLPDQYSQYVFNESHDLVTATEAPKKASRGKKAES